MKRAALVLALLLSSGAPAFALFGFGSSTFTVTAEREAFSAGRYADVVSSLTLEKLPRVRKLERREGYRMLAESYEKLGQLDKALSVYQLAVRLYPRDLPLATQLGLLLHRSGLHAQAKPMFDHVLAIHPNNAASQIGLAEINARLGFLDRSAEFYEKALETMGEHPELWRDYAEVLLKRRDLKTAVLAAERSLSLAPDPETYVVLAQTLRAEGRSEEALARLDQALAVPGWNRAASAKMLKAIWLLDAGRFDEAGALADAALARDAAEPTALWVRARVGLKRDRYNAAVRDLEAAAASGKRAPFVASAASALLTGLRGAK